MKARLALAFLLILPMLLPGEAQAQIQGARFKGVVTDQDGNPVMGAVVKAEAISGASSISGSGKSKADGRYGLFVMYAARQYRFTVTKEGYREHVETFDVGSAFTNQQMRFEHNFTLESGSGPEEAGIPDEVGGEIKGSAAAIRHYNAGATANNEGDLATAIEKFQEAIEADPGFVPGHQALLGLYIQARDHTDALAVAEKLLEVAPTDTTALGARYDALVELQRSEEAEAALEGMILSAPGPATAIRLFNRAATSLRESKVEEAIPDLKRALEMDPNLAVARSALAKVYLNRKEYQLAADNARILSDSNPEDAVALSILYDAFKGLGEAEKAKEAFAALEKISPERAAEAFYRQGVALLDQAKHQDALASFERVLASHPGHVRVHYMLGLCYLNTGDMALAKTSLRKFLGLAPDDRDAPSAREMLAALE